MTFVRWKKKKQYNRKKERQEDWYMYQIWKIFYYLFFKTNLIKINERKDFNLFLVVSVSVCRHIVFFSSPLSFFRTFDLTSQQHDSRTHVFLRLTQVKIFSLFGTGCFVISTVWGHEKKNLSFSCSLVFVFMLWCNCNLLFSSNPVFPPK